MRHFEQAFCVIQESFSIDLADKDNSRALAIVPNFVQYYAAPAAAALVVTYGLIWSKYFAMGP
jgi:hypothetical protein